MIETILKIDGMACGMCESHINDVVRRTCSVKKVTSSHTRGCLLYTSATKRLRENGYITMDKDGLITLTERGMSIASSMRTVPSTQPK